MLKRRANSLIFKGNTYYRCDISQPFSFFKWIFISRNFPLDSSQLILEHEKSHVKSLHSIDVLFFEFLKAIFWFNPFIYLLSKLSRLNNEYFVDHQIANKNSLKSYANLLVDSAKTYNSKTGNGFGLLVITNHFALISLKSRILQLVRKPSSFISNVSYLTYLPFLFLFVMLFSCKVDETIFNGEKIKSVRGYYQDEYGDQNFQQGKIVVGVDYDPSGRIIHKRFDPLSYKRNNNLYSSLSFVDWGYEVAILEFGNGWLTEYKESIKEDIKFWIEKFDGSSQMIFDEKGVKLVRIKDADGKYRIDITEPTFKVNSNGLIKEIHHHVSDLQLKRIDESIEKEQSRHKLISADLTTVYEYDYSDSGKLMSCSSKGKKSKEFTYNEQGDLKEITVLKNNSRVRSFQIFYDHSNVIQKVTAYNKENELEYSVVYQYEYY